MFHIFLNSFGTFPDGFLVSEARESAWSDGVSVGKDASVRISGITVRPTVRLNGTVIPEMPEGKVTFLGRGTSSAYALYRRLRFGGEGTDVTLTRANGGVEVQFFVHPGRDPSQVGLEVEGAALLRDNGGVYIVRDGRKVVRIGEIRAFQGTREVEVSAEIKGNAIRFIVNDYDPSDTLVIDPVVTAVVSGSGKDRPGGVVVDNDGYVYVVGTTSFPFDFAPSRTFLGPTASDTLSDVFVTKLTPDLTGHVATVILSSSGRDAGDAITLTGDGDVVVAGWTYSPSDFAPSRTVLGTTGGKDAFITRLSGDLSTHRATVILGGSSYDEAHAVTTDDSGDVFVAGYTSSSDFAPNRTVFGTPGGGNAFITKLSGDLSTHIATAILTSSETDVAYALTYDPSGYVYVVGQAGDGSDFMPWRTVFGTLNLYQAAFATKLTDDLNSHVATAIVSSEDADRAEGVALDSAGNVLVGGTTGSALTFSDSRTVYGPATRISPFVTRLTPDLSSHLSTAVFGDSMYVIFGGMAVAGDGDVLVTGTTYNASKYSVSRTVIGTEGGSDIFLTRMDGTLTTHVESRVFAGPSSEGGVGVAVGGDGSVFVVGYSFQSVDFMPSRVVFGTVGSEDVVIVKMDPDIVDVYEAPEIRDKVKLQGDGIVVVLDSPAYVGYDVFSGDGRLVKRRSIGYLPAGKYRIPLDLPSKRVGFVLVRVGDRVMKVGSTVGK